MSYKPVYFLMKDKKGDDLDRRWGEEELRGAEEEETVIRKYYMEKICFQ